MVAKKTISQKPNKNESYRQDIDGLRAIAVISVLFFHLGLLPNGYLGVDVFFVISGYLITKIIYNEAIENKFSIVNFYLRRIRRIIPLVLFVNLIALVIGLIVMLPDDLENLGQSVVATNLFSNNILEYIVSKDYWNILNEFKPLMHTWSLGIEEQYYLIYPILFLLLTGKRIKYLISAIILLTILSIVLYVSSNNESLRFYMLPYRFFELSLGGLGSIVFKKRIDIKRFPFIIILILILIFSKILPAEINLFVVVFCSLFLLIQNNHNDKLTILILENRVITFIGKISFSLYMWHQLVFAYSRYFIFDSLNPFRILILLIIVFTLSVFSYYFIEQIFRDKHKTSVLRLLLTVIVLFVITTGIGIYLHYRGGVIKDVPELNIKKSNKVKNTQVIFNMRIFDYHNKEFTTKANYKVLIIGNSLSRDWANTLLKSKYANQIELSYISISQSYINEVNKDGILCDRWKKANIVYISFLDKTEIDSIIHTYKLDSTKYWIIGVKSFGINNGIFYNKPKDENFHKQRSLMAKGFYERNLKLKSDHKERYIDIIGKIIKSDGTVPVFTENGKFISQDCVHLTEDGAKYFGAMITYENNHLTLK